MPSRWKEPVRKISPWMQDLRRAFHRHPELSHQEHRTAERVRGALAEIGVKPLGYPGSTAVTAVLGEDRPGPTVALRADMDALPITEETGVEFASESSGRMHACGHDLHMAMLLGATRLLRAEEGRLAGPVRIIFQPAEEEGLRGGAAELIERGVLERPRVDVVLGQHVEQSLPVGTVGMRPGPMMAAADTFEIAVLGQAGHGGYPHAGPDAIVLAAEIVTGLQALVSRTKSPVQPAVISVGSIHGGERPNILPGRVDIAGTVRTFDPALRAQFARSIPQRARGIAKSLGGSVRVKYAHGYPAVVNDAAVTARVGEAFARAWGAPRVRTLAEPVMGAEDFARYLEARAGSFWFLGVGDPKRRMAPKHSAGFLPDERALAHGAEALLLATDAAQRGRR
jgi:amidohydrolase